MTDSVPTSPRSRLARRLFALFVAIALLPLALSDWVATSAVSRVVDRLHASSRAQATHQASRQVFDRLLAGKTLLSAMSDVPPPDASGPQARHIPGLGRVFRRVVRVPGDGPSHDDAADLVGAWQAAESGASKPIPQSLVDRGVVVEVRLRVGAPPQDQPARVLLGASHQGRLRWIAEFDPAYLWAPLAESDEDSAWTVHDMQGRTLATRSPADPLTSSGSGSGASQALLFLGAEFGAGDWVFEQRHAAPEVRWQGLSLTGWLVLVGAGTLLLIALLSLRLIRHTLRPLQQLTEGTRQLAAGAVGTRVAVQGDDELGVLARAFNDMAGRIEGQLDELGYRATHDSLTGLINRRGLHDHLDAWLPDHGTPIPVAVLFVDLDHFKDVNDSLGHEAGDELLCLAAERLRTSMPADAVVARQGGDEFVLLLPNATPHDASQIAGEVVRSLGEPFTVRAGQHLLGASVGIAVAPEHGHTRDDILRCADIAMYAAKSAGRAQFAVFSPALDLAARDRVRLQAELRQAVERGEFVMHYQPRIRPADGCITSAEALVRWQHPERGLLLPGEFIGIAEESTLIENLGAWVLDEACAQLARWRGQGLHLPRVAVNVSPRQLASGHLPELVRATLSRHGLSADALELEVTESLLTGNAREAHAQLAELRGCGVSIALDDFGTGYSSMTRLRQLPIDVMKIDRAFVKDLGQPGADGEGALAIIRAIVAMAHSLRMHLVAEGIETAVQADALKEMGCDEFQGFLYGRPVPAGTLLLQSGRPAQ